MSPPKQDSAVDRLLNEAIQAARQGKIDHAQTLLLQVVEQDERNERAWLWLSGVVEADEDRRICLENVLAINPDSLPAQNGLARLQKMAPTAVQPPPGSTPDPEPFPPPEADASDDVIRVERPPISPAAAVLYPERQIMELPWKENTNLQTVPAVTYESHTAYNDVWEKESEICAFCAHEVDYDETQCPQCRRKLTTSQYRYPKYSADLIVYFVFLVSTAQLYFIQALLDLIVQAPLLVVAWHITEFLILLGLSGAIMLRRHWAYYASIIILILIFLSMVMDVATGLAQIELVTTQNSIEFFRTLADNPFTTLLSPLLEYLVPFQMMAIFLALVYGIFKAGPDFDRVKTRLIAQVDKGLNDASAFYSAGKMYAGDEMWASAVLHFQRAAAHEPNRAYYHLAAGKAFAQLGFKERALDALSTAQRLTTNDELKAEIELAIATVNSNS